MSVIIYKYALALITNAHKIHVEYLLGTCVRAVKAVKSLYERIYNRF